MKTIYAISKKQLRDLIKNKETFLMFLIFPAISYLLTQVMANNNPNLPASAVVGQFVGMFSSLVMIQTTAQLIAEEKEKKSLRFLMMAGVKQYQYLLGIGAALSAAAFVIAGFFAFVGDYAGQELLAFFIFFMMNIFASIMIGATIGLLSRNIQASTAIAVPVAFILGFSPMIAGVNEVIYNLFRWTYAHQFSQLTTNFSVDLGLPFIVTIGNLVVLALLFAFVYSRKGLRA